MNKHGCVALPTCELEDCDIARLNALHDFSAMMCIPGAAVCEWRSSHVALFPCGTVGSGVRRCELYGLEQGELRPEHWAYVSMHAEKC